MVIVGGGSSLTAAQVRVVGMAHAAGRCKVVAINGAIYLCWFGNWCHACDGNWWRFHKGASRFVGIKTTLDEHLPAEWGVKVLKNTGREGFDPDPSHVRTGSNGAFQALHCLIHAGAARIALLGVDMAGPHWFGDHPKEVSRAAPDHRRVMVPHFPSLLPELKARGIKVVNCSPASKLGVFKRSTIEEFLADARDRSA